ncbi:MAG: lasso peptide biosynthesis B2 protein [Pseudonocardiaceae bacterium]
MSAPIALCPPRVLSVGERCTGLLVVAVTTLLLVLTRARPQRIRRVLEVLHHCGCEADHHQAERAYAIVTTVSLRCASGHGCLCRSLAIILLCRLWGLRVTWLVGFRSPPPQCHAWVHAGGEPVCETVDPRTIYTPMITI